MANSHLIHIKKPTLYNYKGGLLDDPKRVKFPTNVGEATLTDYNVPPTAGLTLYVCGDTIEIFKRKYENDLDYFKKTHVRRIALISNDDYRAIQDKGIEKVPIDYTLLEIDYQERQGKKQVPTIDPLEAIADNVKQTTNVSDYIAQEEAKIGQFLKKGRTKIK